MDKSKKLIYNLGAVFIVFLTLFVISLTMNEFAKSDYAGLDQPRSIRVSGEETLHEVPDEAEIVFSVVTQGEDYGEATNRNSQQMSEVRDYLKENGLGDEDMKTLNFSVSPRYRETTENRDREREIIGYEVENNLKIKFKNLDEIDSLIAGAIDAGANKVAGLSFSVSNEEELKIDARKKAIENAREEAELIADSLGVSVGRVLDYSESAGFYAPRVSMDLMEEAADDSQQVPIEPGENEIRSSVEVTFEIN